MSVLYTAGREHGRMLCSMRNTLVTGAFIAIFQLLYRLLTQFQGRVFMTPVHTACGCKGIQRCNIHFAHLKDTGVASWLEA